MPSLDDAEFGDDASSDEDDVEEEANEESIDAARCFARRLSTTTRRQSIAVGPLTRICPYAVKRQYRIRVFKYGKYVKYEYNTYFII